MPASLPVELKFGSKGHAKILEFVRSRRRASLRKMKTFHQKWDAADDSFRAYQPTSEVDAERKYKRREFGKHDYTTVTIPYSFAIVMTAHTYWSSVFLSRAPIYQLQGRHGESQDAVQAFESVLDYQRMVGEHLVPLYNWIFDMSKYEVGIVGSYWDREEAQISRLVEQPMRRMGIQIGSKTEKVMQSVSVLKYEGNKLYNVRPYDFFPDPRVALVNFQKGEFCGRDTSAGWHEILEGQRQGYYFNIDELAKRLKDSGAFDRERGTARVELPDRPGDTAGSEIPGPGFVNLHEMSARIVPSIMRLGDSNRVETWMFTIANDAVVIGAQPLGLYHDKFPFDIMEYGFGAHEFIKDSLIDVMTPLIDTMSWLFNSRFYNVRKSANDQKVVDPSRVVMKDVTSPIERGIIRLKPEAYGTDARQAVHQLAVPDVTAGHFRDIGIVEQILQRVTGVVDELMGLPGGGARESATGVRTRTGYAANRLRTVAEYNSALGMTPLIAKLVSNTQQLMEMEAKFRIAGTDGMRYAQRFMEVDPQMIAGQYDYVPVDGTLPVDRLAQANFWKELAIQLSQSPIAGQWNLSEIVAHIMRLQGEKNVDRFRLDVQSPKAVEQGVQAGNLVPIEGGQDGGGRPRAVSGGTSGAAL